MSKKIIKKEVKKCLCRVGGLDVTGMSQEQLNKILSKQKRKENKMRGNQKGFSLIELMVVVAIIGVLAAIAVPQYAEFRKRGYVASMRMDICAIRNAQEAYFAVNNTYLTCTHPITGLIDYGFTSASTGNSAETYLSASAGVPGFGIVIRDLVSGRTSKRAIFDSSNGRIMIIND